MRSCKFFPQASNMPTLAYNWANSVIIKNAMSNMPALTYNQANSAIIKNAIILNITYNTCISNLRDTELVICTILI